MDITSLDKAVKVRDKLKLTSAILTDLRKGEPITIKVGNYEMPAVRQRVAANLEAVLLAMIDEAVAELVTLGVEVQ